MEAIHVTLVVQAIDGTGLRTLQHPTKHTVRTLG